MRFSRRLGGSSLRQRFFFSSVLSCRRYYVSRASLTASSIPPVLTSWIEGASSPSNDDETAQFVNRSPTSGEPLCRVQIATQDEVERTVQCAVETFQQTGSSDGWAVRSSSERGRILQRMAEILKNNMEELCWLEALDTGIPISQIRDYHLPAAIGTLQYYAALATCGFAGRIMDTPEAGGHHDSFSYTRREPLGVCVAISGWNYPLVTMMWKIAPALACGNTVIFKPSECTPLTAWKVVSELWHKDESSLRLPCGALQVLLGEAETAQALVSHPAVAKVSLTGSVGTGIHVARQSAETMKHLTLELGGKSPIGVSED